jgi:hypothetical protein
MIFPKLSIIQLSIGLDFESGICGNGNDGVMKNLENKMLGKVKLSDLFVDHVKKQFSELLIRSFLE